MTDKFKFGKCIYCGKDMALKNDVCCECLETKDVPYFMKKLFGGFKHEE